MEALRILWFNRRCWLNPAMGGAEFFTYGFARKCVRHGREKHLELEMRRMFILSNGLYQ